MKKLLFVVTFIFLSALIREGFSRVLVVADLGYWSYGGGGALATYVSDARLYDYSIVDTMLFHYDYHISNMSNCQALWNRIATAYDNSIMTGDTLEGVVLIGYEIPVPQAGEGQPFDFYYMDIWDTNTQSKYASDGDPWPLDNADNNYLSGSYGSGDHKYDVWVSRIWPGYIYYLRTANDLNYQNGDDILTQYLARVHDRHVSPAKVPSRGFAMGGITDAYFNEPLSSVLGINRLDLPMYSEFAYRKANPSRWMAQLQSGPYGSINNGAFYGARFSDGPNTRPCTTAVIPDGYSTSGGTLNVSHDTLGWEWAGIYEHSFPAGHAFNKENVDPDSQKMSGYLMGSFHSLNFGSQWQKTLSGGLENAPYYFYDYNPSDYSPYGSWARNKEANWRWRVEETGNYAIYLYNPSGNSGNSNYIYIIMNDNATDANGYPIDYDIHECHATIDQTSTDPWLTVYQPYSLSEGNSIMVKYNTNNDAIGRNNASAILFYNLGNGHPYYFDCNNVSDDQHNPDTLFAKTGFYTDDWVDRSFLDMQDESPTHDKVSLTPFFITCACDINNFLGADVGGNLGNLYALGHNGLICLGTANVNWPWNNYDVFIDGLKAGKTFGKAFLDYMNTPFRYGDHYELLGAGTLKAQPYIQFGTQILENEMIDMWNSGTVYCPFLFRDLTFSGLGNVDVITMTDENLSPKCSHADIILRPETHLCTPSGNNHIDIKAQ